MSWALVNQTNNVAYGTSIPTLTLSVTKGNLLVIWATGSANNLLIASDGVNTWPSIASAQSRGYGKTSALYAIAQTTATITVQIFQTVPTAGPVGVYQGTSPSTIAFVACQMTQWSGNSMNPFDTYAFAVKPSAAASSESG